MDTYSIDKIRQIAIGTCGCYDYDYFRGVYEVQGCEDYITANGRRYPVVIIGDGLLPILQEEWIGFGQVKEFQFHNGIKRIADNAFSDTAFEKTHMELPESLLEIGNEAFLGSKMKKIVIPRNVIHIGENAFPLDMEIECLSPYLDRKDGNSFTCKTYHVESIPLEFRITDPINKEVSATCFTGKDYEGFVFPDVVNIGGDDYLVTAIDSDFGDMWGKFVLPPHLRKIGNNIEIYDGIFSLPETLKYIGESVIHSSLPLHLPQGLRFIANELECSQIVNHSPCIDLDRNCVLDEYGKALYYFGRSYQDGHIDELVIYDELGEGFEEFDYREYCKLLDSSTF